MQKAFQILGISAFLVFAGCNGEAPDAIDLDEKELAKEQVGQPASSDELPSFEELARTHPQIVRANRCVAIMHEFTGARRLAELDRSSLAAVNADAAAKWLSVALDREMDSDLSEAELNRIQEEALRRARAMENATLADEAKECADNIPQGGIPQPTPPAPVDAPIQGK